MSKICRFCLKTEDDTYNSLDTQEYKTKILYLIPELDINLVENPVTCSSCHDLLFTAHTFKLNCLRTEEQFKKYIKNGETKINLDDVLNKLNEIPNESSSITKFEVTEINSSQFDRGTEEQLNNSVKHGETKIKIENVLNKLNEKLVEPLPDVRIEVTDDEPSNCVDEFEVTEDETLNCADKINIKETVVKGKEKDRKTGKKAVCCKICNTIILKTSLRVHLQKHFKSQFVCIICFKSFDSEEDHIAHNQETHNLTCKFCNRVFFNEFYYKKHVEEHEKFGKLQCQICGLKTSSFLLLEEHSRIHTGERPFKCTYCDKSFAQRSTFSQHVKTVHSTEKPYMCEICGKTYAIRGAHTAHIKTHQEVVKNFVCKLCGKSFRIASELKEHEKRHANIRDRICEFCGKGFVDNTSLRIHMRKHNGDKRYECMICGKKFATNCIKKTHLRSCMRKHASLDSETSTKEKNDLPT